MDDSDLARKLAKAKILGEAVDLLLEQWDDCNPGLGCSWDDCRGDIEPCVERLRTIKGEHK